MGSPQIIDESQTFDHFRAGMNAMADLFARTLGPAGGNVVGETGRSSRYELYGDSGTVARRILSLGSPRLDLGAMLVRSVVMEVEKSAGDGGATCAVLMQAIVREAQRRIAAGVNAMQLVQELQAAAADAAAIISAGAQPIHSEDDLAKLARSVVNDAELASVLGELSYLLGADGYVNIRNFVAPYLQREYLAGARIKAQIASAFFYTDAVTKSAVLNQPLIALLEDPLTTADEAVALLEAALGRGGKALMLLGESSGPALNVLVANQQQGQKAQNKLVLLAAKPSALGDAQRIQLADLALLTGATILGRTHGRSAASARAEDLGCAARVDFADGVAAIVADRAQRTAVQGEAAALQSQLAALPPAHADRAALVERLARLTGGVGELKIGAHTKAQRSQREELAKRTLKVLAHAHRHGVVAGGGAALHHCAGKLRDAPSGAVGTINYGRDVLIAALSAPLRQIIVNVGKDEPSVILAQLSAGGPHTTYDALGDRLCDAFDAGIVDATSVVLEALRAAVSGASMAVSTGAIVYHRHPQRDSS